MDYILEIRDLRMEDLRMEDYEGENEDENEDEDYPNELFRIFTLHWAVAYGGYIF